MAEKGKMDLFIIRGRLKLMLWFVGVGFFLGLLATWYAWRQIGLGGEGEENFLLSATVTGALALAWIGVLVSYLVARRIMKPAPVDGSRWSRVSWWSHIPWGVMKYTILLVFIAAMAFVVSWLSSKGANEFTLLEKEKFRLLEERIAETPELLEHKEKGSGKTLLVLALESGNAEAIDLLLSSGAELQSATNGPNWVVAALPNPLMLETLLRNGADPDAPDANGFAPIHQVVNTQNTNALVTLLEAGADVDARTPLYQTPLMLAIMADDLSLAETLLKAGADPNRWDKRGDTALHKAVDRKNIKTVRFLLEKGADPKTFNFNHLAPIHRAVSAGQTELVELFLEEPGQINLHNEDDRTPLDHALRGHQYDMARLLVERGAAIDRVRANGYTTLHLMLIARDYKTVRFLIEEGADVHITNLDRETAFDLMREKQLQSLLDLIDARDHPEAATNTVEAVESP